MPLKEFFDSTTMMSQPLFRDGAWRFYSIRKRCNHLYMLIYNVPQSLNARFRWVALLPSPTSKSIISPAPLSAAIHIKVYSHFHSICAQLVNLQDLDILK
ncbi:hypothetical protein midi_01138 [Candidatus Midichloria mitochondrii IricVA]|uniref:Uncharacterized protein n=1 Tax=Midichloria mitochondrii (strain IricVA) TaxID=696127 RepID=F7XU56_MIDMI|nr:hypothetical protein midi_01138 [Candidatus Midichloria mitochondrii IricVA]